MISSTQTNDDKQIKLIFDHHRSSYQLLAWHCCQPSTTEDRSTLTILIKQTREDERSIGTLTMSVENDIAMWVNQLNHRRYQLYLSTQPDSIITHFKIEEHDEALVSVAQRDLGRRSLILCASSGLMASFDVQQSSSTHPSVWTELITLQDINDTIYYLTDVIYSLVSPTFIVFVVNSAEEYSLHHLIVHEAAVVHVDDDRLTDQEILCDHCSCCHRDATNRPIESRLVSCSQFLSLVHMTCEIDSEESLPNNHLQLIDLTPRYRI